LRRDEKDFRGQKSGIRGRRLKGISREIGTGRKIGILERCIDQRIEIRVQWSEIRGQSSEVEDQSWKGRKEDGKGFCYKRDFFLCVIILNYIFYKGF
jgi:hypothetical protein